MTKSWTEAEIAELVDNAATSEEAAQALRALTENDPAARDYAAQVKASNTLLQEAFKVAVDDARARDIEIVLQKGKGNIAYMPAKRHNKSWRPLALAASVALAVGVGLGGIFDGSGEKLQIAVLGDAPLTGPLHEALETRASGLETEGGIRPMLSFWDGAGRPCREFEVSGELPNELEFGIACRNNSGHWHVEIIVAAPLSDKNVSGYSPASGAAGNVLEAMLNALSAGPALGPQEEAALIGKDWRRSQDR